MKDVLGILILLASVTSAQPVASPEEAAVRAVVNRFAAARNVNDGNAAAETYSEDGEYIGAGEHPRITRGRPALGQLWGGVGGQISRVIKSVEILAPNVAIVRVDADFPDYKTVLLETYVVIKEDSDWKIRVHQAVMKP